MFDNFENIDPTKLDKEDYTAVGMMAGGTAASALFGVVATVGTVIRHPVSSIAVLGGGTALSFFGAKKFANKHMNASTQTVDAEVTPPAPAAA